MCYNDVKDIGIIVKFYKNQFNRFFKLSRISKVSIDNAA